MPASFNLPGPGPLLTQRLEPLDAVVGVNYPDSATVTVVLSVSSVETADWLDAATVRIELDALSVEAVALADATTVPLLLGASSVELHEIPDAATVLVDLQSSGTEFQGREFLDTATVLVDLQVVGTYNYISNSSFETNTTGYSGFGGTTLTRDTSEHYHGSASLKGVFTSGSPWNFGFGSPGISLPAGIQIVGSVWVKGVGTTIGTTMVLSLRDTNGAHSGEPNIILTSDWQRIETSWTVPGGFDVGVWLFCNDTPTAGDTFYADAVQLEVGSAATPHVFTDGAPGYGAPEAVDFAQFVDSATVYFALQISGTDVYTSGFVLGDYVIQPPMIV